MSRQRFHYLHITEYRILNDWCCLVNEMFAQDGQYGIYLVGGVLTDPDYTDVDIRLIMKDEVYAARYDDVKRKYLNLAVSLWGQKVTGLPIDFQIQPQTLANERYAGKADNPKQRRHAIGHEHFDRAEV